MSKIAFIATGLLVASAASAFAEPSRADIDVREQRQLGRIEQGRQDGSITWTEGLRLRGEQKRIAETEARFMADGRLSKQERRVLDRMQDAAARHITEEANDDQRRRFLPRFGR